MRLEPGTTKEKDGRVAYLPPEALEELRAWRQETLKFEREHGCIVRHVFHHNGKAIRDFYTAWRSACVRAGVEGRVPHDFRRTAARNYRRSEVDELVIMKITRHKTRAVFKDYAITNEEDLHQAAQQAANGWDKLGTIRARTRSLRKLSQC